MDCPRCESSLDAYTLQGSQAAMCDRCGWVGIDASLGGRSNTDSTSARDGNSESPESGADDAPLDTLDGIDTADVEQLRTTGIRTIDELARAEPNDLADATDLPESQVRTHVRRAAIRVVTRRGAEH